MSRSSLWVMDKDFYGQEIQEYSNSWLFSPIAWDILLEKHMSERQRILFDGTRVGFMSSVMIDKTLNSDLNSCINYCGILFDRVLWEMSNQQIFFTKDKQIIADSIRNFLKENKKIGKTSDGIFPLEQEHISSRFEKIAKDIEELNETEYPYFILKNTSCDDNVEYWFQKYDEEEDEYIRSPLSEIDNYITEFVYIDGDIILGFKSNVDFFKEEREEE